MEGGGGARIEGMLSRMAVALERAADSLERLERRMDEIVEALGDEELADAGE